MLTHHIIFNEKTGRYLVAYQASGAYLAIVTDDCATHALAVEALRIRRADQLKKEREIKLDQQLRGARF